MSGAASRSRPTRRMHVDSRSEGRTSQTVTHNSPPVIADVEGSANSANMGMKVEVSFVFFRIFIIWPVCIFRVIWNFRSPALSLPGAKSPERTFALVEFSFRGTFVPGERKVQEILLYGTFAPMEFSLLRSGCTKNLCCMEFSDPWNFHSVIVSLPYWKKMGKVVEQSVRRGILLHICYCLLEWKRYI